MTKENSISTTVYRFALLADEPWDKHATTLIELFLKLTTEHDGVATLTSVIAKKGSKNAIHAVSGLLTDVKQYANEIHALYQWIRELSHKIDDKDRGNLVTAVQRHIILLQPILPPTSEIREVMVKFLLECLDTNDWTIWDAAITSFDGLDRLYPLEKWLTKQELATLKESLRRQIKRASEEWDCGDLGRINRFLS